MEIIPKGSFLVLSTGEYDDYRTHGVFKALVDINAVSLRSQYRCLYAEEIKGYNFMANRFIEWAIEKALLEKIDSWEWHLSDYGDLGEMKVKHGVL